MTLEQMFQKQIGDDIAKTIPLTFIEITESGEEKVRSWKRRATEQLLEEFEFVSVEANRLPRFIKK